MHRFTTQADFTAMSNPANPNEQLHVDDVYHKAFVEVNEEAPRRRRPRRR